MWLAILLVLADPPLCHVSEWCECVKLMGVDIWERDCVDLHQPMCPPERQPYASEKECKNAGKIRPRP